MSAESGSLADAYAKAIERYLGAPSEATLETAYEIGRAAIAQGVRMIDVAVAHQRAVARLLAGSSQTPAALLVDRAMQFLIEALSPFELALGGFRDSITRLEHEVAERARAQDALRAAHDHLEERVQQRTAELFAANERLRQEVAERERAEHALREAETSYESLVVSVRDYAIFMLDPEGVVASWNPGAQRIKGYLPHEIIGTHFSVFYTPEDRRQGRPQHALAQAIANGSYEDEGWRVRKDGTEYWADVVLTARRAGDGALKGFTKVTRDATERRQARQALEAMNAELQRSNEEKDQFVAMISHELRNPLAAVVAGAEVLATTALEDPRARRAIEIVKRNAAVQKRLVDDLLDFSRFRRDRVTLQRAPVALDSLVETVVSGEEADAASAGVTLALASERGLWVVGDGDRLQQAMLNLVGNAIKFTPSGGRVDVSLFGCAQPAASLGPGSAPHRASQQKAAESVCLVIEDTGTGIDPALLARLFLPFQQGEIASRRQRGLGLGLALVKLIVERHGGAVWAESKGQNRGSRFVVALPLLQFEHPGEPARPKGQTSLLLVEDNADTRTLLAAALQSAGYRVAAAASGEEALALLGTARPDLLLSDIGLPGMSGYEFLRRARAIEGMARVPAFAVTARDLDEDVQRARDAGFEGHFVKPVDPRALDRAIRAWFAASQAPGNRRPPL